MRVLACAFVLPFALVLPAAHAAEFWTGPTLEFRKENYADPALPENQDCITANVCITRGPAPGTGPRAQGIYNAAREPGWDALNGDSPVDTLWAFDATIAEGVENFDFETWRAAHESAPEGTVGRTAVVYLVSDDVYLELTFTDWVSAGPPAGPGGGGFSYLRTTPNVPPPAPARVPLPLGGLPFALGLLPIAWCLLRRA